MSKQESYKFTLTFSENGILQAFTKDQTERRIIESAFKNGKIITFRTFQIDFSKVLFIRWETIEPEVSSLDKTNSRD